MCGSLGWTTVGGEFHHDADWLSCRIGPTGTVQGEIESTLPCEMPVDLAGDCADPQLTQVVNVMPATATGFTVYGSPGQEIWIVPDTPLVDPPCGGSTPQEYVYELHLWGLEIPVAVDHVSWSAVKRLHR